jgi:hypothetical protein
MDKDSRGIRTASEMIMKKKDLSTAGNGTIRKRLKMTKGRETTAKAP